MIKILIPKLKKPTGIDSLIASWEMYNGRRVEKRSGGMIRFYDGRTLRIVIRQPERKLTYWTTGIMLPEWSTYNNAEDIINILAKENCEPVVKEWAQKVKLMT